MINHSDKEIEKELSIIDNLKVVKPPEFFFTRLKARIERENQPNNWTLPFHPIWAIGILIVFLIINSLIITEDSNSSKPDTEKNIQALATAYDQNIYN